MFIGTSRPWTCRSHIRSRLLARRLGSSHFAAEFSIDRRACHRIAEVMRRLIVEMEGRLAYSGRFFLCSLRASGDAYCCISDESESAAADSVLFATARQ